MNPQMLSDSMISSADIQSQQISANQAKSRISNGLGNINAATAMVSNVDQLKKKYPKLFKEILQEMAMTVCDEMQKHAAKMKEIMRKNET